MLLIKNGRVVDPVSNTDKVMDVLIDNGTIIQTGDDISKDINSNDVEIIDATGFEFCI